MHNQVINVVEKELGLPEDCLLGHDMTHKSCIGRYICYRYLHEEHMWSANKLARVFGRSRKNIFRGIMVLRNQMVFDKSLRTTYAHIVHKIEGMTEATPSDNMEE